MIRRAFLQDEGSGRLGPEARDLLTGLSTRGIPAELFTRKRLARRQLSLDRQTLVAGEVAVVIGALRQLGIEPPAPNDYPASLRPVLRRRVWASTVRRLVDDLTNGPGTPVFAKPLARHKRFTGRVFDSAADLIHLEGASLSTPVHCAEVVAWLSESRAYICRGQIVGVRHYAGDRTRSVDEAFVIEAVRTLEAAGEAVAGYALDFGILADGRGALVEWNDGFALGSYGLEPELYTELILARWCELIGREG